MESQLDQKIREYKELLDRKEELENLTKENNAAKEKLEQDICKMMIDEEKPSTIVDGFNYSLSQKVMYSKNRGRSGGHLKKKRVSHFSMYSGIRVWGTSSKRP